MTMNLVTYRLIISLVVHTLRAVRALVTQEFYSDGKGGISLFAREDWNTITVKDGAGQIQWQAP